MEFSEKLKLIKASILVANFWGVDPSYLVGFPALGNDKKKEEWNKIAREVQEFDKMGMIERGKKLGFNFRVNK